MSNAIYGVLGSLNKPRKRKTPVKRIGTLVPKKINPDLKYNTKGSTDPDAFKDLVNHVDIPLVLLKAVTDDSQKKGRAIAGTMLGSSIPNIMGFSSAIEYTTSVLADGFNIKPENIATNEELNNVLNTICSLEIIRTLLKCAKLDKKTKRRFMKIMTEDLAKGCASLVLKGDRKDMVHRLIKNGLVSSRKQVYGEEENELGVKTRRRN